MLGTDKNHRKKTRRLEAAEMWCIRRIMSKSWTEKKSHEDIMKIARCERAILKTIRKGQLQFLDTMNRADGSQKQNY